MYTFISYTNNVFYIKNLENNNMIELSSVQDLCEFLSTKLIEPDDSKVVFEILKTTINTDVFSYILQNYVYLKSYINVIPKIEIYEFLKTNIEYIKPENAEQLEVLLTRVGQEYLTKLYKQSKDKLNINVASEIVKRISDDKLRIKFFKKNKQHLNIKQQFEIIRRLSSVFSEQLKINFLTTNQESLSIDEQCSIVRGIYDDKLKLKFLKDNKDNLHIIRQFRIVETMNSADTILNFFKENYEQLLTYNYTINVFPLIVTDKDLYKFLKKSTDISKNAKRDILFSIIDSEFLYKIYESNQFNSQTLIPADYMYNCVKDKYKFLAKYINNFSGKMLQNVQNYEGGSKYINQILLDNNEKLNSEHILFLILNSFPEEQDVLYTQYKDRLNTIHKCLLIASLQDCKLDASEFDNVLKDLNIPIENKNLVTKIVQNFGVWDSIDETSLVLLTQAGLSLFREEDVFQLFKYCIYTNSLPDISKAVENPELFEKFQQFRKDNLTSDLLQVVNIHNTLHEFNKYFNLISECFNNEMNEQETAMLASVLNDERIEISNKDDLKNYPQKRSEYIDQLIETDIESAITYIFTGLNLEDYLEKEKLYFNNAQLDATLKDYGEELQFRILFMQTAKDLMDFVKSGSQEKRKELLQTYKKLLEQEFTLGGSPIADVRNAFTDFATTLKTLYGQELQESLKDVELPKPEREENVDVIKLNGQDFKLLIHGLNAYGTGVSSVYENREVGKAYICTSLISNKFIGKAEASIFYGFKNISSKALALEAPFDMFSYGKTNSLNISSNRGTKFLKADELMEESAQQQDGFGHNEIVLYRDQVDEFGHAKPLEPDYVVAFDKISEYDKAEAERLNIPIVLINSSVYNAQFAELHEKYRQGINKEQTESVQTEFEISKDKIVELLKKANKQCSAIQQEAIMQEIKKAFMALKQKSDSFGAEEEHSA